MKGEVLFGIHAVLNALVLERVQAVFVLRGKSHDRRDKILQLAKQQNLSVTQVTRQELESLTQTTKHQGVAARVRAGVQPSLTEKKLLAQIEKQDEPCLLLILDGVQDPHNLGACLRTADAAGAMAVIAPKDRAVGLTPTVNKVASGAAESVPFLQVANLARLLDALKQAGVWIYGTSDKATESVYDADTNRSVAWVLGNEQKGLRRLTEEKCDALYAIPMQGLVSSLNVSVAAGVCLFETVRQRQAR